MTDRARAIQRHATRAARRHHQPDRVRAQLASEQRVLATGDAADFHAGTVHRSHIERAKQSAKRQGRKELPNESGSASLRTDWILRGLYNVTSAGSAHCAGYLGPMNVSPCAGAVAPACARSREDSTSAIHSTGRSPTPTSSSEPTMLRTM